VQETQEIYVGEQGENGWQVFSPLEFSGFFISQLRKVKE
jgi:hypothetical protein